jgi:hypothetical protein
VGLRLKRAPNELAASMTNLRGNLWANARGFSLIFTRFI